MKYRFMVQKLVAQGLLLGGRRKDENGYTADMDLSQDMLRMLVIEDRAGLYGA